MRISRPGLRTLGPFLALAAAACSGPAPVAPQTRVIESGPLRPSPTDAEAYARTPVDPAGIGWVTSFRSEAVAGETGEKLEAPWRVDLRLANGTRLLVATSHSPDIRFPAGFALPLGQIVRDAPKEGRDTALVAAARDGAARPIKILTTIEFLPVVASGKPPSVKRLYVLSLPVLEEGSAEDPAEERGAHWQVPAGQKTTRNKYNYVVPVDSTVHYGVALLGDLAKYMRLTDTTDGKVLWEADPVPGSGTSIASIPVYSSETGFPLYRDHEYEIEVLYDNPGPAPIDAMAVLYLYYRPPGTEEFSYPYTP